MKMDMTSRNVSRRDLLLYGGALTALATAAPAHLALAAAAPRWWERIESARAAIGNAAPIEAGITLDLPLLSEDGSSVALTVAVDSSMTASSFVSEIHLYATRNPTPDVAVLRLTPALGRANIQTRIRLGETQTVGAIATMSDGTVRATARDVRITTSGCFVRADAGNADEMAPRVRVPAQIAAGKPAEVVTLLTHPMETGLRPDANGNIVPQKIVKSFSASLDGTPVLEADLFRSVAANPYFRFFVMPQRSGKLEFAWTEDTGRRATATAAFVVS